MTLRTCALALVLALAMNAAHAEVRCAGNVDALGTERILKVDAATTPRIGRKHFPQTLPLAPKEVVLTFDDGPEPRTTARVLDALKHECVRASFFLLGRSALAHKEMARRELAEGHTVAHHTFAHPLLNRMPVDAAVKEIERGFAAVDPPSMARPGESRRHRSSGFQVSPPRRLCSTGSNAAASWCSAPTFGQATGIR